MYIFEYYFVRSSNIDSIYYFYYSTFVNISSASLNCSHCPYIYLFFYRIMLSLIFEGFMFYLYLAIRFCSLVLFTTTSLREDSLALTELIFSLNIFSSAFFRKMGSLGNVSSYILTSYYYNYVPSRSLHSLLWILMPSSILRLVKVSISEN